MTTFPLRIEEDTKKQAVSLADKLGLSLNAFMNTLLKKAIREGGADLRLTANGYTKAYEQSIIDADKEGGWKEYASVEELIADNRNEDQSDKTV